jgi:hypothetical protein
MGSNGVRRACCRRISSRVLEGGTEPDQVVVPVIAMDVNNVFLLYLSCIDVTCLFVVYIFLFLGVS